LHFVRANVDSYPPIYASHDTREDRQVPPCPYFSVEMGSWELFCPGWPTTTILPTSAPSAAGSQAGATVPS
jgi:hypothetical protein